MSNEIIELIRMKSDQTIEAFKRDLSRFRTGRASHALVENIRVDAYGSTLPLSQVGTVTVPESRLIVIQPWDKSILGDVEKGISTSELGLTPVNNGELIRIQLPMMSTERRDELIKLLNKKLEECKAHIRNSRKDFQNGVRDAEKKKTISEDFAKRLLDILQKETDKFIAEAEKNSSKKEQDIKG